MKVILAFVLAVTLVVPINNSVIGKEASSEFITTPKCQLVQQALMTELYPKIRSILRERYRTDFLFGNARVLPILNSDKLVSEFKIEGEVLTKDNSSETVQITFRADVEEGYIADGMSIVSKQPSE